MAEAQLQQFLEKVRQLQAFVALSEARPELRAALRDCSHHHQVVALARQWGFEIGRRWGEPAPPPTAAGADDAEAEGHGEVERSNLLAGPQPSEGEERTTVLLETPALRLERIHSCAFASPPDVWYDQREHEWVLLLSGSARLRFADEPVARDLGAGDSLLIAAHRRHRLEATDPAPGTLWLALFWPDAGPGPGAPASRPRPSPPPPPPGR